jgi:hypothetical protein
MARVHARAKSHAVARTLVRTQIAGEYVANLGGSESAIRAAQQGIASGKVKKVSVHGINTNGDAVLDGEMSFDHGDRDGEVLINSQDGISMLEALDPGLAASTVYLGNELKARNLKPEFRYTFSDAVQADPELYRQTMQELDLRDAEAPQRKEGTRARRALDYKPGQDKGIQSTIDFWRGDDE